MLVVTYCIENRDAPFLFTLESDQGFLYINVTHGDDGVSEPMQLIQPDAKLLFQRKLVKFHEGDCLLG